MTQCPLDDRVLPEDVPVPVVIPDETLKAAGLTEREAVLEIACHLFDAGKLALWPAAKPAGMSRGEFEAELGHRKIAVYRPAEQDFANDLAALNRLDN
jgi:predicted HTH domain antitoxin